MKEVIVFKHIPKTGGSSFGKSVTDAIGKDKVLKCYGKNRTSPFREKARTIRSVDDYHDYLDAINSYIKEHGIKLAYGHFLPPLIKTWSGERIEDSRHFTMFRHPYTRVISAYNHQIRQQGLDIDFEEWLRKPEVSGKGRRWSIMCVGDIAHYSNVEKILFYEQYAEGLAYMSDVLGVELKECKENIKENTLKRSADTDKLIENILPDDIRLYEHFWKRR